jgi:hypothetical protein
LVNLEESKTKHRSTKIRTNLAFLTHEDTAIVTPIATHPNLRAEPISVPVVDTKRYYALMMCDENAYNFGYLAAGL